MKYANPPTICQVCGAPIALTWGTRNHYDGWCKAHVPAEVIERLQRVGLPNAAA